MSADVLVRPLPAAPAPKPRRAVRTRVRERGVLPLPLALLVVTASGIVYSFAFPAPNIWILAFVGVAGFFVALRGRGFWSGFLVAFVGGLTFWLCLIDWITLFLGAEPLIALAGLEALIFGLGGGFMALTYRSVPLLWHSRWGRVGLTPLIVAAAWTAREVVAGTAPYGGFAWGRLSLSQSTSPFAPLAAWFGLTGLSFVLAWLIAVTVAVALEPRADFGRVGRDPDRAGVVLPRLLAVAILAGLVLAIPPFRPTEAGVIRVAAVQPNTHAGYFDPLNNPSNNLDTTVRATAPAVGTGTQLVVWPEGGANFDPFHDAGLRNQLEVVAEEVGAPLLTGAITERSGVTYNSSVLWTAGAGITGLYDKVHPVPFAEYVPDRKFWTPLAPELFKLIGRDYAIGTRSSVLTVGGVKVGVDICFDIVDDGLILGSVGDGAQVLVAQTNNADFGTTEEHEQQLAIARLRAIETGRSVVSSSTVASTSVIAPDGVIMRAAKPFTRQTLVADVPLATGTTPAVAFGIGLGASIALLGGLLPLIAAGLARPLRGKRRSA